MADTSRVEPPLTRRDDDSGFTLIEVGVALALFAALIVGLTASLGSGLQLVGRSSARQNAVQIASRNIEDLRAIPFARLGHSAVPLASTTPGDPDNDISGNNYTVPAPNSVTEPFEQLSSYFIANTCPSPPGTCIPHLETVTTESVTYKVYRYVTQPTSPTGTRRVSVTVTWRGSEAKSNISRVNMTTLVSPGVLAW